MLTVEAARTRIVSAMRVTQSEVVPLAAAAGRVLAADCIAAISHPPTSISAMDGYALRRHDAVALPATLRRIGVSRAGRGFTEQIGPGQCVRIFTGAPVPEGADAIALQEDAEEEADGEVHITAVPPVGTFIRTAGVDISSGAIVLASGQAITCRALGALAAAGCTEVTVRRRPKVAIFSTGDELVDVGERVGPDGIVDANRIALAACVSTWGGVPIDLGIVRDRQTAIMEVVESAGDADLLLSSGGASVGEHDLVRRGLSEKGFQLDFWRIAMRPGKPLMFGHIRALPVLGLPGNPVSAIVCALLFLQPALRTMLGLSPVEPRFEPAYLAAPLGMNDQREDYLRAHIEPFEDGRLVARPLGLQDSMMLSSLAHADGLIRRRPHAAAAMLGARIEVLRFPPGLGAF
jgi:molybdopterin molybdotransferase